MDHRIDRRSLVSMAALLGLPLLSVPALAEDPAPAPALPLEPVPAAAVDPAEWSYLRRPVIVFADTPRAPDFLRQMELIGRVLDDLALRDVILITDTDPATPSALRRRFRPHGFALIVMDKDWASPLRKPLPWDGREIVNAIDRMPIARSEALERNPAGR